MLESLDMSRLHWDVFFAAFFAVALWESFRPRRKATRATARRWGRHGGLAAAGALVGLLLRTSPLMVALAAAQSPYGVLNRAWSPWAVRFLIACLVLDCTRYVQHRLLHGTRVGWRVHQVHHSDEHFDLTTALRFHPGEALFTHGTYLGMVALMAPPIEAVLIVELVTVVQNFFAHANVQLPIRLERILRKVWITPELHRVHHSVVIEEQNTNFGTIFPIWDRLFGTYLNEPAGGHECLRFGLKEIEAGTDLTLPRLLAMPFGSREGRQEP